MYRTNDAYMNVSGNLTFMFAVMSGVLQGCPLSGSLFVPPQIHIHTYIWQWLVKAQCEQLCWEFTYLLCGGAMEASI